jgi:hypothetical protein
MEPFVMVFPSWVDKDIRFEHKGEEFPIAAAACAANRGRWS